MTRPEVGDPVPPFEMTADDGSSVSSDSLLGRRYVLYFYPKDDTPGCTKQACGLRDSFSRRHRRGLDVYGVSPDSVKSHVKFREKYALPYRLLSDAGHRVAEEFGVWVEQVVRWTRVHGDRAHELHHRPAGEVEHVLAKVKPDEHVGLILDAVGA